MDTHPEMKSEDLVELANLPELPAPATLIPHVLAKVTAEEWARAQLRPLPDLPAPPTLIPRVLAALAARAKLPWWRDAFWAWPMAVRIPAFAFALMFGGLLVYLGFSVPTSFDAGAITQQLGSWFAYLNPVWEILVTLANAFLVILQKSKPYLMVGWLLVFVMYAACLGLGTACFRMVFSKY